MKLVEQSTWVLNVNGKPAINELGELEQKLADVRRAQSDLKRGTKEWTESQKEVKALEAEIKKVRETMGTAGMTVKQLEGYHRQLNKEIKLMTPGTDEYIKKTEELREVNTRLNNVRKDIRGITDDVDKSHGVWSNMKKWIVGAFTMTIVLEAIQMIREFVVSAVENYKKYDAAAKELSANTNIIGQELDYLKKQAKDMGPQMGKTADEMLAAYQMMGSAKSDLTDNAAALAAVTKEAMILSQAGKIELAPATELMAGALNQFNAPASDAGRFINAIAAGAQVGSAEIVDMTGALKASGTVANAANVSFEQTNGALQSLSTINIKGEQAGTMFRNMLIKLMSSTDDLNPQIVGLEKSLDNLARKNMTTAELAKMFGTENVVAAQHLMTHRDQVKNFTESLTGTDAAYKMAATNSESLEFKQAQMSATMANLGVSLGEKLGPYLMRIIDGFIQFSTYIGEVIEGATPLLDLMGMLFSVFVDLWKSIGRLVLAFLGIDEGVANTKTMMQVLTVVIGTVVAAAAALAAILKLVIDSLLFLDGRITFEQLKANATNSFEKIKQGLKSTFVDQFKEIEAPAVKAQTDLTRKQGDARAKEELKTEAVIAGNSANTHKKTISDKESREAEKRKNEEQREKEKAQRIEEERLRANETANRAIEKMHIDAIADEKTRKLAQLEFELKEKLAANTKSKADDLVKTEYEIALREDFRQKAEKIEKEYRDKHLAEEKKRLDEVQKLEDQQRTERQNREYQTTKSILESKLSNEKLNISERQALKLQLIELERQKEIQRIEEVAAKERQKAFETSEQLKKLAGDDAEKKKQIDADYAATAKAIDDKLLAEKAAANQQHQDQKKEVERKSLEERRANQESFFNAIKAAMNGDYNAFVDLLSKKLMGDKEHNNERLANWTTKTSEILGIVAQSIQVMQQLNQKYLEDQINRNNKERNDKIKKLQEQYQKGLIDKATYESGVNNINKQADAKEKELKLKAWKRDQAAQIAMAAINGAMAALKSLATMGWPLGLVGVAASAAITIAQVAMIKRQQPPQFAQGGTIKNAGVPNGPRHGSSYGKSGIGLVRRDTGEEVGEMEGGEPIMILSRNTYRNNRRVIDRLLHSSLHRNGAPIYARDGAVFGHDGGTYGGLLYGKMYRNGVYDDGSGDNVDQPYVDDFSGDAPANTNDGAIGNSYTDNYGDGFDAGVDFGSDGGFDAGVSFDDGSGATGDAAATTSITTAEIQKSQALMERIGKNTADTARFTEATFKAVGDLGGKIDNAIQVLNSINGAANRTADNAGNAANASWAAASASNRAADAVAMSSKNDL
jgi:TP901 family phage tail tape measure protein